VDYWCKTSFSCLGDGKSDISAKMQVKLAFKKIDSVKYRGQSAQNGLSEPECAFLRAAGN